MATSLTQVAIDASDSAATLILQLNTRSFASGQLRHLGCDQKSYAKQCNPSTTWCLPVSASLTWASPPTYCAAAD